MTNHGCAFAAIGDADPGATDGRSAARLAARAAVGRVMELERARQVQIVSRRHAPPRARLDGRMLPVSVSLTHAGSCGAALAVPAPWRCGVDVERAGSATASERRFFLSEAEDAAAADVDTTLLWCLKEAAWKALACSPSLPLRHLELVFAPHASGAACGADLLRGIRVRGAAAVPARARLRTLRDGWLAALVVAAPAAGSAS